MACFYLDLETTGLDPEVDEIITIQYQELSKETGKEIGDLRILKSWESSEKDILERFISQSGISDPYIFKFIPVGFNFKFDNKFLKVRCEKHGLNFIEIINRPHLDLHTTGVLMNKGEFRGASLDKLTGKDKDGSQVPDWYSNKEFDKITEYIKMETREFVAFYAWLSNKLPQVLSQFREENKK